MFGGNDLTALQDLLQETEDSALKPSQSIVRAAVLKTANGRETRLLVRRSGAAEQLNRSRDVGSDGSGSMLDRIHC